MKEFKLSIIGFGTVGRALCRLICNKTDIKDRFGVVLKVVAIFEINGAFVNEVNGLDLKTLVELPTQSFATYKDWKPNFLAKDKLKSIDYDILVELSKTNLETGEPAYSFIMTALMNNKDVVTSNKGPIALYYPEIMEIVNKKNLFFRYEATVGGIIPIIGAYVNLLLATKIVSISCIVNGTTNYILTKMTLEKIPFEIALKEAQEKGYAESDPTLDIQGFDAAAKIVILANTILGYGLKLKDVKRHGIDKITLDAIELASEDGYVIKHIATARNGTLEVCPKLIPDGHTLDIEGTKNIIILETEDAGDIVLSGRGAGGIEAASAVLSDILFICDNRKKNR